MTKDIAGLHNYQRGTLSQAAQTYVVVWGEPNSEHFTQVFADELMRQIRNLTQNHEFAVSEDTLLAIAQMIVFANEGYVPKPG